MKLEIGNFPVREVTFGAKTGYAGGVLTINKEEALALVREDSHITEADLVIARPGEQKRIVPVKEAIEPRCKLDGSPLFPGVTGELASCEGGVTHALKGAFSRSLWRSAAMSRLMSVRSLRCSSSEM